MPCKIYKRMKMIRINRLHLFIITVLSIPFLIFGCSEVEESNTESQSDIGHDVVSSDSITVSESDAPVMEVVTSEESQETISDNIQEIDYSPYYALIEELTDGLKNGFTEDQQINLDVTSCFYYTDPSYEIIGYMLMDIDGDGINELLFGANSPDGSGPEDGWDSIVYDVYTINDGMMLHIFSGAERSRYYLCENGTIANEGSDGAAYTIYNYYDYVDDSLKIIESVYSDEAGWYHSKMEAYEDQEAERISEDEASDIESKYQYKKLIFTPFIAP